MKEDPIDVFDDSDDEKLKCDENVDVKEDYDVFSVDGSNVVVNTSEFDADALVENTIGNEETQETTIPRSVKQEKSWFQCNSVMTESNDENKPELNTSLRLTSTDALRKAKRRMESCFIDDHCSKIKKNQKSGET